MTNVLLRISREVRTNPVTLQPETQDVFSWIGQFRKVSDARSFGRQNRCKGVIRYRRTSN